MRNQRMIRVRALTFLAAASLAASTAAQPAPKPYNQLELAGNACGPAALLNSLRFGGGSWRAAEQSLAAGTDKERIRQFILTSGGRESAHLPGRPRWSRRGVGLLDLRDMANELDRKIFPRISAAVFFREENEPPGKILARLHGHLGRSLGNGFPPVLSIRRHARGASGYWRDVDAHFVTILAVGGIEDGAFAVRYADPWGGKIFAGRVRVPQVPLLAGPDGKPTCAEADFPHARVGKNRLRKGEATALSAAAALGDW